MSEEKKAWEKRKEQLFLDKKNGYDVVEFIGGGAMTLFRR